MPLYTLNPKTPMSIPLYPFFHPLHLQTLPFIYPYNRFEDSKTMIGQVKAMEGTISEEEYIAKTKEPIPMFGNMTTPMEFHGFNEEQSVFPFWTSEPYTYATTLLALSHFQNTDKEDT